MNSTDKKYSVVIPSIGRWNYLSELIGTIENQNILPQEIILLLDSANKCESGPVEQLLSRFVKLNIRVIYCDDNLAAKRNYGAQLAETEQIFFSDDDDLWMQQKAEKCLRQLLQFDVVSHNYSKFGELDGTSLSKLGVFDKVISDVNKLPGDNVFGGGSSIVAKRDIICRFPFDPKMAYCEDFHWWLCIINNNISVKYLGLDLVSYRAHNTNMTKRNWLIFKFSVYAVLKVKNKSFSMWAFSFKTVGRGLGKFIMKSF